MGSPAAKSPYAGHRFPAEVISHAVWPYFRFPLGLRMVEEMLAARGVIVSHETVRHLVARIGWLEPRAGRSRGGAPVPRPRMPPCRSKPTRTAGIASQSSGTG
jgi:hypothetical protein